MFKKKILSAITLCLLMILPAFPSHASESASVTYESAIIDEADLFSDSEEEELQTIMAPILAYGNVVLITADENPYGSTQQLSETIYRELPFENDNGVAFVIDMDERYLWVSGFEDLCDVITDDYCETITDNVYTYASDGDYFTCTTEAFYQIDQLLQGKSIPRTMKYVCNFLISIILAFLLNYIYVMVHSRKKKASATDLKQGLNFHCHIQDPNVLFLHETKRYNPRTSSSGGGSRGGGGGRSSGGGHRF